MKNARTLSTSFCFALSLAVFFLAASRASLNVQSLTVTDSRALERDKPIVRNIGEGQTHTYRLKVAAGEFFHVVVRQRGVNVAVALYSPDGGKLFEADSPLSTQEAEWLTHVAAAAGEYRVEVRAVVKGAAAGEYEIKLEERRQATAEDDKRVTAETAFIKATKF